MMRPQNGQPVHFIANRLSLDFVNTAYGVGDERCDVLTDDESVLQWLKAAGAPSIGDRPSPLGLVALARELRTALRRLVESVQAGRAGDAALLNQVLQDGQRIPSLSWQESGACFEWTDRARDGSASSVLYPVAMDLASLLASDDSAVVRQCEAHDCTLLFVDTTKSRRRRWCSMAVCGNRMKVAAFRARNPAH